MKKTDQTVEEMIMRSHYLNALELESGAEEPLSDMEREAFLETMQDLKEIIKNSNDMIRSLQDTIRNLQSELDPDVCCSVKKCRTGTTRNTRNATSVT